jgi:hypothetical protein
MFLMSDADNSELVKLMLRRLDANDLSRLVELMSPDVEFANLLQLLGLFGINRNACSASAETTVRLHPKSVCDFIRNGCSPHSEMAVRFRP